MYSTTLDIILIVFAIFFVVTDIVLALCVSFILPRHVFYHDWFPAYGQKLPFSEAAEICSCLHYVFPNGTNRTITFGKIPTWHRGFPRHENYYKRLIRFPFIISIVSEKETDNNDTVRTFSCVGMVKNKSTAYASSHCVNGSRAWFHTVIRSNSPYWSRGGVEHVVTSIHRHREEGLMEMEIKPEFPKTAIPKRPVSGILFEGKWKYAVEVGWDNPDKVGVPFTVQPWISKESLPKCSEYSHVMKFKLFLTCDKLITFYYKESEICEKYYGAKVNSIPDDKEYCLID